MQSTEVVELGSLADLQKREYVDQIVLRPDAEPPFVRFDSLYARKPDFHRIWNRRGRLEGRRRQDERELASYAAEALWPAQEMANLLIRFRRRCDEHPVFDMDDLISTITWALSRWEEPRLREEISVLLHLDPEEIQPDEKRLLLLWVRCATGVPFRRVLRYGEYPCHYAVELDNGRNVSIGSTRKIRTKSRWAELAFMHGRYRSDLGRGLWSQVILGIHKLVENGN